MSSPRSTAEIPISDIIGTMPMIFVTPDGCAGRIAVFGAAQSTNRSQCAIRLARALAEESRVVLVGLGSGETAIRAVSNEPSADGLAELAHGIASFRDIITKDRLSPLHLISPGHTLLPSIGCRFFPLAAAWS